MKLIEYRYYVLMIFIIIFSLSCERSTPKMESVDTVENSDYYKEQYRNQYHFSPEANWMNDPNGMVFLDGEYHLFYQYYPDSTVWGPMHWAHAVSEDLVHWEHLPIAIYPDSLGYIFSGSAVIDHDNTAGFGDDAMIAIYTYHDIEGERSGTSKTFQYQAIAYSLDKGRTFTKYEGNPVIPNPGIKDFRDPKVIWDEKNNQWVLVLAAYDKAMFYTSPDLKAWTMVSEFGIVGDTRLWECPDLFPIKVKDSKEIKWVLVTSIQKEGPNGGTATSYFVGDWDGKKFIGDANQQQWLDYGTDNYAAVSWANPPSPDDEIPMIGWMSNWQYAQVVPSAKWRSAMTLARTISLHKEGDHYSLRSMPVKQMGKLVGKTYTISPKTYSISEIISKESLNGQARIDLKLSFSDAKNITFKFSNDNGEFTLFGFDVDSQEYFIDRTNAGRSDFSSDFGKKHTAPVEYVNSELELIVYLDHACIEMFADQGRTVMTDIVFPTEPYTKLEIMPLEGSIEILEGSISELTGIWQ